MENLTFEAFEALVLAILPSLSVGLFASVLPFEARIRIEGWPLLTPSIRGFWVRKTEPRNFCEVLERSSVRDEKNCGDDDY